MLNTNALVTLPVNWLVGLLKQIPTERCGYCGLDKPADEVSVAIKPGTKNQCDDCAKRK